MSQQSKDILDSTVEQVLGNSSPFVENAQIKASPEDLFVGDTSFLKDLDSGSGMPGQSGKTGSKIGLRPLYLIAAANVAITALLAAVVWLAPTQVVFSGEVAGVSEPNTAPVATQSELAAPVQDESAVPQSAEPSLSISLSMAEELVEQGQLVKAADVFRRIMSNITLGGTASEEFRDYLKLRIAVCLHDADQAVGQDPYFSDAMSSRSGMIRGLVYHYLSLAHFRRGDYLQSRKCAYQAMALIKTYQDVVPANLEEDLYFLAAECLTRYAMTLHPTDQDMPGRLWSDSLEMIWPKELDQAALCETLLASSQKLAFGAGGPRLEVDTHRMVGSQWLLVCLQTPAEEVLAKMASQNSIGLIWQTLDTTVRSRPVTVYLPYVAEQYVAEVVAGSTGLIWKYDGQNAAVSLPDHYDNFAQHRAVMMGESIAIWRRFLLQYRGDHRIANAHYALGRIYSLDNQYSTALAEFKVIQSHFAKNPLAPFAYLEASQIRTQMKDYGGAKADLNEMLLLHPDCVAADKATLYLAEASLESGQLAEAKELYSKVYQLNLSETGRLQAAYGLGRCAFLQSDWPAAKTWLSETLGQIEDKSDSRLATACLMLGRSLVELGENQQAGAVLRMSLGSSLSDGEYVQIIEELVQAEMKQENYLEALNIIESIPESRLNQKDSCDALILKSRVLRAIDAAPSAASLLRRKIEYIADSRLRAWLTLELAESYYMMGDYTQARRELNDVIAEMEDAVRARQASLLLARIADKMDNPDQAEIICLTILANADLEPALRQATFELLGNIYTRRQSFDKAAMAFAGVVPQQEQVQ
jgi:TolA-binding protein